MAKVESISVALTLVEAHAVHRALGRMAGKDYANAEEAEAGSNVYNALVRFVDDEDD